MINSAGIKPRLTCIVIGAGVSGILMGQKLAEAFDQDVTFQIFEKNADVGGTWHENRYPGCACDVPSHIYQYNFCPNPYWSSFYASSAEIKSYLKAVVFKYGLDKHICLNSKVIGAVWNSARNVWTVSVEGKGDFESNVLINAGGILNNINTPKLKNLESFHGPVLHTAIWQSGTNLVNKRVAIIGAGASAFQCLPAILPQVDHVDIYIRTPSWISPPAGGIFHSDRNHVYTEEEKSRFNNDLDYSASMRKKMESLFNSQYEAFHRDSHAQEIIKSELQSYMKRWIPDHYLQSKLIPTYEVGCRRISPGEAYLEALQSPKVEAVFDDIDEVTAQGVTAGSVSRPVDIIITAVGFDTSFKPRWPVVGTDGVNLRDLWKNSPVSYFGLAVSGFPNYLLFLGPNTPAANGSLMGVVEATGEFFIRLLKKMVRERIVSFNARKEAQSDFDEHTTRLMKSMVFTGSCSSWYKSRTTGKITALWPGSSLHYRQVLETNRWEDFEWKYDGNRYSHWGRGFSDLEISKEPGRDLAPYITTRANLSLDAYYESSRADVSRMSIEDNICKKQDSSSVEPSQYSDSTPMETDDLQETVYEATGFSL